MQDILIHLECTFFELELTFEEKKTQMFKKKKRS